MALRLLFPLIAIMLLLTLTAIAMDDDWKKGYNEKKWGEIMENRLVQLQLKDGEKADDKDNDKGGNTYGKEDGDAGGNRKRQGENDDDNKGQ